MYVDDAKGEILQRIKSLDQEESFLRRRASQLVNQANSCLDQADRLAQTRRQYEFAHGELGGDNAPASKRKIPVETQPSTARVIKVNSKTPA